MMKLIFNLCLSLIAFSQLTAQENKLLGRDFWNPNIKVADLEKEIKAGNNPVQKNEFGFNPTVYAILQDAPLETILYLLDYKGNETDLITHDNRTYLFWSAYKSNLPLTKILLERGSDVKHLDSKGWNVISFISASGVTDSDIYEVLLNKGAELNDPSKTAANPFLYLSSFAKDEKILDYFLKKGINPKETDKKGNNAIAYAAKGDNLQIIKYLKDLGIQLETKTSSPNVILTAAEGLRREVPSLETFKYLEENGVDAKATNDEGNNAITLLAGKTQDIAIFKYFLLKGVDINQVPKSGVTALAKAVENGNLETVKFFLDNGAKTQIQDDKGNSLLNYWAQTKGDKAALYDVLKQTGFDFGKAQPNGEFLIHLAAKYSDSDLLKWAISNGNNINTIDKDGNSPLMIAAMNAKSTAILKSMVEMKADKNLKSEFGETAYDLAKQNENLLDNKEDLNFLK